MKKIVINVQHGGFGVSREAAALMASWGSQSAQGDLDAEVRLGRFYGFGKPEYQRDDPLLVRCVEEMGSAANGFAATLKVVEIPDDVSWVIEEYDGLEWIAEEHRTWN